MISDSLTVNEGEKDALVAGVFDTVSSKYDLMNDLISFGMHRLLKRITVKSSGVGAGDCVLDLACGTGDFAKLFVRRVGVDGKVVLCEINRSMLDTGRGRFAKLGIVDGVDFVLASAEEMPFEDDLFDCVVIGYGIRNFSNKPAALSEIRRVLKPGGRLLVLEFSKPTNAVIRMGYRIYSNLWPLIGRLISGDGAPYEYLIESIRLHPDQEALKSMIEDAGLRQVAYRNFLSGVCALHSAVKPGLRDAT